MTKNKKRKKDQSSKRKRRGYGEVRNGKLAPHCNGRLNPRNKLRSSRTVQATVIEEFWCLKKV